VLVTVRSKAAWINKRHSYDNYKTKLLHVVGDSVNYSKNTHVSRDAQFDKILF